MINVGDFRMIIDTAKPSLSPLRISGRKEATLTKEMKRLSLRCAPTRKQG